MNPLRQVREHLELSQTQLAEKADVDQSAISRAEASDRVSVYLAGKLVPHLAGIVTEAQLILPDQFPFSLPPNDGNRDRAA
jgi:predicted transcriptional regulator